MKKKLKLIGLATYFLTTAACSSEDKIKNVGQSEIATIPVYFSTQLSLSNVLNEPTDSLKEQLSRSWYDDFPVKENTGNIRLVGTCHAYFEARKVFPEPTDPLSRIAYFSIGKSCEAIQMSIAAKPSKKSFLTDLLLDEQFPSRAPNDFASVVSNDDERMLKTTKYWSDMDPITRVESKSKEEAVYYSSNGAIQTIQLLAKGDFNGDGIEDALFNMSLELEGGSYFSTKNILVTRTEINGDLLAISPSPSE